MREEISRDTMKLIHEREGVVNTVTASHPTPKRGLDLVPSKRINGSRPNNLLSSRGALVCPNDMRGTFSASSRENCDIRHCPARCGRRCVQRVHDMTTHCWTNRAR